MNDEILKKLQDTELSIMKDLDVFFKKYEIPYSLFAGTLIGAIRHKGFIPWDDDIDICMDRKDYERFLDIWEETGGIDGYYLQSSRDLEKTAYPFSKIRKNNTVFIGKDDKNLCDHNGIWIDIFPLEKVPRKKNIRVLLQIHAMVYLILTRRYPYNHGNKLLLWASTFLLRLPQKLQNIIRRYSERCFSKYKNLDNNYDLIGMYGLAAMKRRYPYDLLQEVVKVPFEDTEFYITKQYDLMLRIQYGDYMQFPPEEQRVCGHSPQKVEF